MNAFTGCVQTRIKYKKENIMFKQLISLLLISLLVNLGTAGITYAATETEKNVRFAGKVKTNIFKLGTGQAARVKVKLRDKTKLEGYISAADEKTFTITDLKTGAATTVDYPQVKSVKGNNLSTGAKIAIGVGIAAAVIIFLIYYVVVVENDD
jgi:hypothetical protein